MSSRQNLRMLMLGASIVFLTGCAKSVETSRIYECPAPPAVEIPERPSGHIGSVAVVDWMREAVNRLTLQVGLLTDTVRCYEEQVRQEK